MKINEIIIGKKINLGNYESLEIRMSVSPSDKENEKDWRELNKEIFNLLNIEINQRAEELR